MLKPACLNAAPGLPPAASRPPLSRVARVRAKGNGTQAPEAGWAAAGEGKPQCRAVFLGWVENLCGSGFLGLPPAPLSIPHPSASRIPRHPVSPRCPRHCPVWDWGWGDSWGRERSLRCLPRAVPFLEGLTPPGDGAAHQRDTGQCGATPLSPPYPQPFSLTPHSPFLP